MTKEKRNVDYKRFKRGHSDTLCMNLAICFSWKLVVEEHAVERGHRLPFTVAQQSTEVRAEGNLHFPALIPIGNVPVATVHRHDLHNLHSSHLPGGSHQRCDGVVETQSRGSDGTSETQQTVPIQFGEGPRRQISGVRFVAKPDWLYFGVGKENVKL